MRSVFDARRPGLIHLDGLAQRVDILGYIGKMILRRKIQSAFYTPQRCANAFHEPLSMRKILKFIGIIQDNAGRNLQRRQLPGDRLGICRLPRLGLTYDRFGFLDLAQAFFAKAAMLDGPIQTLIGAAMRAGALRRAEPGLAAGQLLSMIKHFLMWPEFLPGAKADLDSGAVIADCVDMFLAHYAATGQAA